MPSYQAAVNNKVNQLTATFPEETSKSLYKVNFSNSEIVWPKKARKSYNGKENVPSKQVFVQCTCQKKWNAILGLYIRKAFLYFLPSYLCLSKNSYWWRAIPVEVSSRHMQFSLNCQIQAFVTLHQLHLTHPPDDGILVSRIQALLLHGTISAEVRQELNIKMLSKILKLEE